MELLPPVMMVARRRSTLDALRLPTVGTWMASLLMAPACRDVDRLLVDDSGSRYRTRFDLECFFFWCLLRTPDRASSSFSRWRSGSSSASCSAMSPVSVQEDASEASSSDPEEPGSSTGWPWPWGVSSQDDCCSRSRREW
jgi:hypothetical protein